MNRSELPEMKSYCPDSKEKGGILLTKSEKSDEAIADSSPYHETLVNLMAHCEKNTVVFKEALGTDFEDETGKYFSAISNEAYSAGLPYGWFILGVSEEGIKHPVGTSFLQRTPELLEQFKYSISRNLTGGMTFLNIMELHPVYEDKPRRVLMFQVPAAATGMPTAWKGQYYGINGASLCNLPQYKVDLIRGQKYIDWSKRFVPGATVDDLDKDAIALARWNCLDKMNTPHIKEEMATLSDEEFLTRIRLIQDGHITNAAMLLLGKEECDDYFERPPIIMWRLYDHDILKSSERFTIPFISAVDQIMSRIRILTYKYLPDPRSLFPSHTLQYDPWILRELLANAIVHSDYRLGGWIYVNELNDSIKIGKH